MKTLPIVWTRVVKDGRTCRRCGSTQRRGRGTMTELETALRPL